MVYTTYFAKLKDLPSNILPIAICAKPPKGYMGLSDKRLAPNYNDIWELKRSGDTQTFTKRYGKIIDTLDPNLLVEQWLKANNGGDVALVCFEKPEDFCHRHLVASWLRDNNIECTEYKYADVVQR